MAEKNVLDLKQVKRTVHYTDAKGKKVDKEITLQTPSYQEGLAINDLANGPQGFRDYGEIYSRLMAKVLVNPHFDYKYINELVEKNEDAKGTIEFEDRNGENVKLNVIFPNAREATNLIFNLQKSDGSANATQIAVTMNDDVFRDENDKPLTFDYWADHGNIYEAIPKADEFLFAALGHTGFLAVMGEAFSFLQEQI
ncbi:hypothetical protein [Secundilactobacillus kimchicus]|uniref:hypothetical protein n=1 Tax=Secundilactobacillus kimchicus TaxID=528209 RepID=UPI0024A88A2D|nr:hypothetical protein [Secundilactobacillus kimchicus]